MTNFLWGAQVGDGTPVVVIQPDGDDGMYVMSLDYEIFTAPLEEITLIGKRYELREVD